GRRATIPHVRPNRLDEITTSTAVPVARADSGRLAEQPALFEDATPSLGGHTHTENTFDDWDRQFLLPNGFSQLGPGIALFDLDRDGAEDLVIGTGKGGRLAVFHNEHGRLVPQRSQGPIAPATS